MNGVYKTNIDCSFIQGMVENYVPSVKFNLCLLFTSALRASVNSRQRLNFTSGTIIFHHSPHEQSILVYYLIISYCGAQARCSGGLATVKGDLHVITRVNYFQTLKKLQDRDLQT